MNALERIQNAARGAALNVEIDSHDKGILRLWKISGDSTHYYEPRVASFTRTLVGIVVIRDERVRYAELGGRIIAHDLRSFRIDKMSAVLRAFEGWRNS